MFAERNGGFDKGMAQGVDRGSREKAVQTAYSFPAMGFSAHQVARGVGLAIDEVETLV